MTLLGALAGCTAAHRYPDGTGLEGQLEREVIALSQQKRELEARVAGCAAQPDAPDSLYLQLYQVFRGSEVEVTRSGLVTVLTVRVSHLYADPYRFEFRAEADGTLDLLATALALHPDYRVMIVGHVDDRPIPRAHARTFLSTLDLSSRLAHGVAERLVDEFHCDPRLFGIGGRGSFDPEESNDLDSGRDANQRIELWLAPPSAAQTSPE
jgi:flagellar motor protein MotB